MQIIVFGQTQHGCVYTKLSDISEPPLLALVGAAQSYKRPGRHSTGGAWLAMRTDVSCHSAAEVRAEPHVVFDSEHEVVASEHNRDTGNDELSEQGNHPNLFVEARRHRFSRIGRGMLFGAQLLLGT